MPTVADHNGPQWLVVRSLNNGRSHKNNRLAFCAGYYGVRVCPCHFGEPVTVHYDYESDAQHARDVILSVAS